MPAPLAEIVLHDFPPHPSKESDPPQHDGRLIDSLISTVESIEKNATNRTLLALDILHNACKYLQSQFSLSMSNAAAKANIQARGILIWAEDDVVSEAESVRAAENPRTCRLWRER